MSDDRGRDLDWRCRRCGAWSDPRDHRWEWHGDAWRHRCANLVPGTRSSDSDPVPAVVASTNEIAEAEVRGRAAADAEWLAAVRAERSVVRAWCEAAGCRRLATLCDDRGGPSYCYCDDHATEGGEEMVERMADVAPLAALVDRALAAEGGR